MFNLLIEIYKQLKNDAHPKLRESLGRFNIRNLFKKYLNHIEEKHTNQPLIWRHLVTALDKYCGNGLRWIFQEACIFV